MMAAQFTPEQEARIREIALEVAIAASHAQAQLAANHQIDLLRLRPEWVAEFLSVPVAGAALAPSDDGGSR